MPVTTVSGRSVNQTLFVNTAGTINTAQIIAEQGLGTPTISSAVAGDTQVTLTWSAVDGATNYDVRVDGSTILSDVGSSPYAVTSLTNDTSYTFEVRATDGASDGAWSGSVSRTPAVVPLIFSDDFSSGDFSGAIYSGIPVNATVTTDNPLSGTHSLRFEYTGSASGTDATAQRNFNLGALYDNVTLEFDLYIPDGTEGFGAAYTHRNDSPSNNKLFRIWSNNGVNGGNNGYASDEKIGGSLVSNGDGGSNLAVEWTLPIYSSMSTNAVYPNFITDADHGTWINCRFYMQYPTAAGANDGIYRIWRNGTLIIDELLDNWREDELHGMQFGYLLGAANSGFDNDTSVFLDNLVFRGVEL